MFDVAKNGKRLAACRGEEKLETVAKALHISASALSMYENGKRSPKDDIKVALANYYGTMVQALFFDT